MEQRIGCCHRWLSDVLVFEEDSLPCVRCSGVLNPDVMASVVLPGWAKVKARLGVCLPSFSVGGYYMYFYGATKNSKWMGVVVVRPVEVIKC